MRKFLLILLCLLFSVSIYGTEQRDTVLTTRVYFKVNTNEILKNDIGYEIYINEMLPYMYDHFLDIESISFCGSASPEGPLSNNIILAKSRVDKLAKKIYFVDESKIHHTYISENYDELFNLVDTLKANELREIYNRGKLKTDIKFLPYYDYLRKEIYPQLRSVKIEMIFKDRTMKYIQSDTVYVENTIIDTVYIHDVIIDTVYIEKPLKRIPILGIKTNSIADAIITPNIQAELYTHFGGISLEFEYTFPWYKSDKIFWYYQILNGSVGIRKYFKNDYTGHYIGIYGNTTIYDICFNKDNGYQGEGHGAGFTYGYVFQSKNCPRLKFEPYIRLGWFNTRYDTYHVEEPFDGKYYYNWYLRASDFVPRRFNMNYFGPTMIGFNLTYDLICLRKY